MPSPVFLLGGTTAFVHDRALLRNERLKRMPHSKKQSGFTLVEVAVVLVIATFLITAILGSQSVLRAARVNSLVGMVGELRTGVAGFQDRYGFLPGDCPAVLVNDCFMPITTPAGVVYGGGGGNGNGFIDCCVAGSGLGAAGNESFNAAIHLFTTGFISRVDSGNPAAFISTPWGAVDITNSDASSNVPLFIAQPNNGSVRATIVFSNLPCEIAIGLDLKIDDGNVFLGRAMGVTPAGVPANTCPEGAQIPFYAVAL